MFSKVIKKYKNMPVPVKASFWYTICNVMLKGISFFSSFIYVRILTKEEYGQYTVFQSWRDIIIVFATLNLYCGVFTKAMVDYEDDRNRYVSCMQGLSTVITFLLFLIYLPLCNFWDSVFELDFVTMILMFIYYIGYPAMHFWTVRQRVEYKYVSMVVVTIILSFAVPLVSIAMFFTTDLRENAVIWGYLIVQALCGMFFYIYHFIREPVFYVKDYWIHALKFNIPLIPHYLSLIVLGQADRIMIKDYCGKEEAGVYGFAYQISLMLTILVNAINNSLVPWTYSKLKDGETKDIKRIGNILCLAVAILTLIIVLISPEVVLFAGTEKYSEAVWIIPMVSLSVLFTFCYNLYSTVEFYFSATKFVMIASSVGAILNIVLNALFIPKFGYIAAGYTTALCYFVFMIMHCSFMKSVCRKEKVSVPYNNVAMFSLCIVMSIFSIAFMLLNKLTLVRYIIALILSMVLLFNRKKIIFLFKKKR